MEEGENLLTKRRVMLLVDLRVLAHNIYPHMNAKTLDREVDTFIATLEKLSAVAP